MKRVSFTLKCMSITLGLGTHAMNHQKPSNAISIQSIQVAKELYKSPKQELCSLDRPCTIHAKHTPKALLHKKQRKYAPLVAPQFLVELTYSSPATTSPQKCRSCDAGKNSTASQSLYYLDASKKKVTQ